MIRLAIQNIKFNENFDIVTTYKSIRLWGEVRDISTRSFTTVLVSHYPGLKSINSKSLAIVAFTGGESGWLDKEGKPRQSVFKLAEEQLHYFYKMGQKFDKNREEIIKNYRIYISRLKELKEKQACGEEKFRAVKADLRSRFKSGLLSQKEYQARLKKEREEHEDRSYISDDTHHLLEELLPEEFWDVGNLEILIKAI